MMRSLSHLVACLAVALAPAPAAFAHHSQSEYDLKGKVEVEGAITKVEWRSPHAWIYVDVVNDKGETVNWSFELPSPVTLMRRGWTRNSLKPGDTVTVDGSLAKDGSSLANARTIKLADGRKVFAGSATETGDPKAGQ